MQGYKDRTTNRTLLVMMPLYVHSQEEYTCDRIFNSISQNGLSKYYKWDGKGYTKHYFEGDRRVCSKLGGGFTGRTEDDINDRIKPITGDEYDKLFEQQYQGMKETFGRCMETDVEFNLKYDPYKTIMENELGRDEAEPAFYYQGDHLGSSAYLTDEAGAITQTLNYLPYGEDWVDVHNSPHYLSRYKYNGKEKDPESGLHYYGARYYDSDISQWLSIDPMADKYPSLSPYNYCADNPVILVDPDGREIDPKSVPRELANMANPRSRTYNASVAEVYNKMEGDKSSLYVFKKMEAPIRQEDKGREVFGNVIYNGEQTDDGKSIITINYTIGKYKRDGSLRTNPYFVLLEEFFHCEQIILGKFGFAIDRNGNWSGMLGLDLTDELEAKTAETDYNYSGEIKYNSYGVYKSNRFMFHKPQNQK